MLDRNFILHLSLIEGVGSAVVAAIMKNKGSDVKASDLYSFSMQDWMQVYGLKEATAAKVVDGLFDKIMLTTELDLIARHDIKWASLFDDEYPQLLREIYMPPIILYWRGGDFNNRDKCLAIVGARASNDYGMRVVHTLVPDVVSAGLVVVSGGALGIDTHAHRATLNSGGKTIVVLGSGLLNLYPLSNTKLFDAIIGNGGIVLSSFPLRFAPLARNFPARNRIIAGLSHACLVVQAAEKSGALITAHYALEQGRDVFAIPGMFDDELSVGCHNLIKRGAKLIASAHDIIEEYGIARSAVPDKQLMLHDAVQYVKKERVETKNNNATAVKATSLLDGCTDVQKIIIGACAIPVSLDDIIQKTELDVSQIQSELFNLQLDGKVSQNFVGMWVCAQ